ncbi:MAG: hypothetical protein DHS20C16_33500 [Phycisphaerae bacterium]|nr:MAG: hypothetical protein DHS20C16_33500 [Phycisphaerae bacterium]
MGKHTKRITCKPAILLLLVVAMICGGCASVSFKRFETATRIDLVANPGLPQFSEPFQTNYSRAKQMRRAVCTDPAAIQTVLDLLRKYEKGWANYWAIPPESAPITLMFHDQTRWLGTLDVHEKALGHVHDLIRKIPPEDASKIIGTICDFASETGNLRGPQPEGGRTRWSRTSLPRGG